MAAHSPFRCSPFRTSTSFPVHCTNTRRRRVIVHWTSDSKSCVCAFIRNDNNKKVVLCYARNGVSDRADAEVIEVENDSKVHNREFEHSFLVERSKRLSLKSWFGITRALWRRFLFPSKRVKSIILLNLITIIYASNIPVVKEVEGVIDPEAFTVIRFSLAAIPFTPFILQARVDTHTRRAGMELGFWVSLGYILQALGLLTSDAGRASFLCMFTVIVVPLIDGVLGAKIPARTWFGALMSIVGVAMLESSGSPPCIGDLLNFLSAVSFGIHMLRTEHFSRSTKKENFLALLGYEVCIVALLSAVWYFVEGCFSGGLQESNPLSWTLGTTVDWFLSFPWIPALYTGIFSTGMCLWVEMTAMRDVSATDTAIIYGLEPVWGAGFAWFLLGERWGISGWIGAALVLGGSLMVQIMGAKSDSDLDFKITDEEGRDSLISDKSSNSLSATTLVVNRRKDPSSLIKK